MFAEESVLVDDGISEIVLDDVFESVLDDVVGEKPLMNFFHYRKVCAVWCLSQAVGEA